jgi:hypothetical protein
MVTDHYVSAPLLHALSIADPYPWKHHVEAVLRAEWGPALPEVRACADAACRAVRATRAADQRGGGGRMAHIEVTRGRVVVLRANYYNATFRGRSHAGVAFPPEASLLLPADNIDMFSLQGEFVEPGDEPAADTDCDLVLHGADTLSQVDMRCSDAYLALREWAMGMRLLIVDVVDADRLLRTVARELGRSYPDVLRSVYPSARAVFPSLVYTSRGPIGRSNLRGALHPSDQDMIRSLLDRAAAGMQLPEAQRPLALPELIYQTDDEEG